ncbi:MAG: chloride channel protein [Planctomycetes bacterium]|nr:chloride channel protein [Planctomycetota bacterium]
MTGRATTGGTAASGDKFDAGELVGSQPIQPLGKLPLLGAMVGLVVGLVGVAFFAVSQLLHEALFGGLANLRASGEGPAQGWYHTLSLALPQSDGGQPRIWLLAVIPAAGGMLLGLWYLITRDRTGSGLEFAIRTFHQERGRFPALTAIRKFVASCITLGTGGSAGREGPIAMIGAAIGSALATRLNLTVRQRRVLLVAGIAAGIGGMFRAPLAGGLMAAEILYSDSEFEPDVLVPAMLASIVSYCVFCLNFGWGSLFGQAAANYRFNNPLELLPLTALALALALAGFVFTRVSRWFGRLLSPLPALVRPAVGAGVAGTLALVIYFASGLLSEDGLPRLEMASIMGDGYALLQMGLQGSGLWWVFLLVAGGKIIATALTLGSGGAGGDFAPSVVIGGCVGAAVGILCYQVLPVDLLPAGMSRGTESLATVTAVFSLVGMAGFWAGVAKVPISSVIIVSELTGSYHLLLPAMWTCAITFVLARRFRLMESQVPSRRESPAHRGDFATDVLKEMRVADMLADLTSFETVQESTPLQKIIEMQASRQAYYPVLTREGRFAGVFSMNDLRAVLSQSEVWQLLVAADVAHRRVTTVKPSDTLAEVAAKFADTSYDELPVVADDDQGRLVGIISRRQLNNAYIKRTMVYQQAAKLEHSNIGTSGRN